MPPPNQEFVRKAKMGGCIVPPPGARAEAGVVLETRREIKRGFKADLRADFGYGQFCFGQEIPRAFDPADLEVSAG